MAGAQGIGRQDALPQQLLCPQVQLAISGQGLHDVVKHLRARLPHQQGHTVIEACQPSPANTVAQSLSQAAMMSAHAWSTGTAQWHARQCKHSSGIEI